MVSRKYHPAKAVVSRKYHHTAELICEVDLAAKTPEKEARNNEEMHYRAATPGQFPAMSPKGGCTASTRLLTWRPPL